MSEKAQVFQDRAEASAIVKVPCQFGFVTTTDKHLAEFTQTGVVVVERHPILPPLFWDYAVLDEKERLVFTSKWGEQKLGLDTAVEDPFADGVRGRCDCLLIQNSKEFPAGMILSCERDLWDSSARQLTFQRTIKGTQMTWGHLAHQDKAKDYFRVTFANPSQDTIHLRLLTDPEKSFFDGYQPFGLFLSSRFLYLLDETHSLVAETIIGYPIDSPWEVQPDHFYVSKARERSFGKARWQEFAGYRQQQDVFVGTTIVDRVYEQREYARESLAHVIQKISSGSPASLSWKVFQSLFSFQRMGSFASDLYGEYGALRMPPKPNKK